MLCKIVRSQNNFQWFRKKFDALEFVSENSRHPQPISFQTYPIRYFVTRVFAPAFKEVCLILLLMCVCVFFFCL